MKIASPWNYAMNRCVAQTPAGEVESIQSARGQLDVPDTATKVTIEPVKITGRGGKYEVLSAAFTWTPEWGVLDPDSFAQKQKIQKETEELEQKKKVQRKRDKAEANRRKTSKPDNGVSNKLPLESKVEQKLDKAAPKLDKSEPKLDKGVTRDLGQELKL